MSIYKKLFFYFVPLPVGSLFLTNLMINNQAQQKINQNAFDQIKTITIFKWKSINNFIEDNIAKIKALASILGNNKALDCEKCLKNGTFKELDEFILPIQKHFNIKNILLSNKEGIIVYASDPVRQYLKIDQQLSSEVMRLAQKDVYFGDIEKIQSNEELYSIFFVSSLKNANQDIIGYLITESMVNSLFDILSNTQGLGKTGESFLVKKHFDDTISYTSFPRQSKDLVFKKFTYIGDKQSYPAQKAVQEDFGVGITKDYLGNDVIASWRKFSFLNWGLVVKIDQKEVNETTRTLTKTSMIINILSGILLTLISFIFFKSIANPLEKLAKGFEIVTNGNWDHRLIKEIKRKDEIGRLAIAFDRMTTNLQNTMASKKDLELEILERTKVEKSLKQSKIELETLLYVTSHDLKEPLRAIEYFSLAVHERCFNKLELKDADYLRRIIEASKRINTLIEDIIQLAKSKKIVVPSESQHSAREIIDEALGRLNVKIIQTSAKITIADDLPLLNIDAFWATQALYNLINNALKFVLKDTVPDITIVGYRGERGVGISVLDRGPGVPEGCTENIFELFKRAVGREIEGTGAGLAIVQQIAYRHGGVAWVEARENGGSVFSITFGPYKKIEV